MPKKGYKQTEEHRLKNTGKNNPRGMLGKKQTQTAKDKIRKGNIGKNAGEKSGMFGKGYLLKGENNYRWKGGEYKSRGRWLKWVDGILYCRARYVAMKCLGRELSSKEIVHHINEIIDDDRPENLYLFATRREHMRWHRRKIKPTLISNLL